MKESRDNKIIEAIASAPQQRISVDELAVMFNISPSTIRRDLARLDREHKIVKLHGGATSIGFSLDQVTYERVDTDYFEREETDKDIKNAIARHAARFVKGNMCIYLDASTSVAAMIPYLPHYSTTFYVTNSPYIAQLLAELDHKVFVTGGELKLTTNAYIGGYAIAFLENFNFNLGFFGTNGIHKSSFFTTPDPVEANIKIKALSKCLNIYILASHTKFDNVSNITFSSFNKNITVISDDVPSNYQNSIKTISLNALKKDRDED